MSTLEVFDEFRFGADDILPILEHVIIQAKLWNVWTMSQCMKQYFKKNESELTGEVGYCYITFLNAITVTSPQSCMP